MFPGLRSAPTVLLSLRATARRCDPMLPMLLEHRSKVTILHSKQRKRREDREGKDRGREGRKGKGRGKEVTA